MTIKGLRRGCSQGLDWGSFCLFEGAHGDGRPVAFGGCVRITDPWQTKKTSTGVPQPVTIRPEMNTVKVSNANYNAVLIATGRYLGTTDSSDTSQNMIYALKDSLGATGIADVRGATMVGRTLAQTTGSGGQTIHTISVSGAVMDWATKDGWYMDLNPGNSSPGERVSVNSQVAFNLWKVAANVSDANVCNAGGYSFLYSIDLNTGLSMSTAIDHPWPSASAAMRWWSA